MHETTVGNMGAGGGLGPDVRAARPNGQRAAAGGGAYLSQHGQPPYQQAPPRQAPGPSAAPFGAGQHAMGGPQQATAQEPAQQAGMGTPPQTRQRAESAPARVAADFASPNGVAGFPAAGQYANPGIHRAALPNAAVAPPRPWYGTGCFFLTDAGDPASCRCGGVVHGSIFLAAFGSTARPALGLQGCR